MMISTVETRRAWSGRTRAARMSSLHVPSCTLSWEKRPFSRDVSRCAQTSAAVPDIIGTGHLPERCGGCT
jgi:hypothetical protein